MEQIGQHTEDVSARVRGSILGAVAAAGLELGDVARLTGCRVEALAGEADLYFEELVQIGRVVGCPPARFFD